MGTDDRSLYGDEFLPLPPVGTKIRLFRGKNHQRNWAHWGTVEAIVNDDVMVVLRCIPVGRHFYQLIDRIEWHMFQTSEQGPAYQVKEKTNENG